MEASSVRVNKPGKHEGKHKREDKEETILATIPAQPVHIPTKTGTSRKYAITTWLVNVHGNHLRT